MMNALPTRRTRPTQLLACVLASALSVLCSAPAAPAAAQSGTGTQQGQTAPGKSGPTRPPSGQDTTAGRGAGQKAGQAPANYIIGPNDVLTIRVFNLPENTPTNFVVGADGAFTYPYIEEPVKAAGLTARAVEDAIRTELSRNVLRNPQVSVTVESFRSQEINVTGPGVANPGPLEFTGSMNVLQALGRAGYTFDGTSTDALIVRATGGTERVDLLALQKGDLKQNLPLAAGDNLIVQEPRKIFIEGHVARPGEFAYRPGLTVRTALSLAGGIVRPGSERRLQIFRLTNGSKERQQIDVEMDDPVQPDDIIRVRPGLL